VLGSCIKVVSGTEIEKYVKTLDTDQKGRINYQKLILKLENPKTNFPLKALAVRLTVFMQQNGMTAKALLDKLIETKNSSKTNKARNKATTDQISTNFFAKFIKAKVDKKRTLEELKEIVDASIDMDKDGCIGLSDLDAFLGRASYH
jgi:Ca2+-binding EF-hand superfamily protein